MKRIGTPLVAVLAIGLLAGSVVGVAAQEDAQPAPPVEFTAQWQFGAMVRPEKVEVVPGALAARGGAWNPRAIIEASDPRLAGRLTIVANSDAYTVLGGPIVWHTFFQVENDGGSWRGVPVLGLGIPGVDAESGDDFLMGQGDYEGLIAVFRTVTEGSTWDLHGYIIEGELPPAPEPYVAD